MLTDNKRVFTNLNDLPVLVDISQIEAIETGSTYPTHETTLYLKSGTVLQLKDRMSKVLELIQGEANVE